MINYCVSKEIDDKSVLEEVIKRKHEPEKSKLKKYESYIKEDYDNYQKKSKKLEKINADKRISEEAKEILIKTYDNNPKALQEAKTKIKSNLPQILKAKCPYCMISAHSTFDHYLDKSDYPEFSLLSLNLIPACAECNSLKQSLKCDSSGNRLFVNFIFDKLPSYPFLKYDIDIEGGEIVLKRIYLEFQDKKSINKIIMNHFDKLDLINRLKDQFDVEMSTLVDECNENKSEKDEIEKLLKNKLYSWEKNKGVNNWETCFLRAIVGNERILSFLSIKK